MSDDISSGWRASEGRKLLPLKVFLESLNQEHHVLQPSLGYEVVTEDCFMDQFSQFKRLFFFFFSFPELTFALFPLPNAKVDGYNGL